MSQTTHFNRLAPTYDERRQAAKAPSVAQELERLVGLRGVRLLDIGCGTGWTLHDAVTRFEADGVGVEPAAEMAAVARERGLEIHETTAERLPFGPDTFDRAVMQLVVHHVDRAAAFGEAHRVLRPAGALAIVTRPPESLEDDWACRFLPSYGDIAAARFPATAALVRELVLTGFSPVVDEVRTWTIEVSRDAALDALRGRASSNYELLPAGELENGIAMAERTLPATVGYPYSLAFIIGNA